MNKKEISLFIILLLIGFFIRLYFSWRDMNTLVTYVADDAFIYLKIAKNFVTGKGLSFDGITKTNGFHPFFLMILIPLSKFFSDIILVNIALSILSLFNVLTAIFVFKILDFLTSRKFAFLGMCIWLFNPWSIFISLSGIEVATSVFFISTILYFYLKIKLSKKLFLKDLLILGILSGLAFLSRSDTIFLPLIIFLDLFVGNRNFKPFMFACVALIIAMPWFVWSFQNFGTIMQGTAFILDYKVRTHYLTTYEHPYLWIFLKGVYSFYRIINHILSFIDYKVVAVIAILSAYFIVKKKPIMNLKSNPFNFALFFILSSMIFYSFIFLGFTKNWYMLSTLLVSIIYLSFGLSKIMPRRIILLAFLFIVFYFINIVSVYTNGIYPWQTEMYEGALWLRENTPEDSIVGSYNTGIYGYFSNRTVINLDGVANNEVHEFIINKQLDIYIKNKNITHIIDYDYAVKVHIEEFADSNYFNMMYKITTINGTLWDSDIVIYRVKGEV